MSGAVVYLSLAGQFVFSQKSQDGSLGAKFPQKLYGSVTLVSQGLIL